MRKALPTGSFKRNLKHLDKRGWDLNKLRLIILLLQRGDSLPKYCRPHKLSGAYLGFWECHIEPDWLLIYSITETKLVLIRTGTHADLFD